MFYVYFLFLGGLSDDSDFSNDHDDICKYSSSLKNVRKRRFRKVARQKTQDRDEMEKEVRRLFR